VPLDLGGQGADGCIELEQVVGGDQARDDSRGARAEAASERDPRGDVELEGVGGMQALECPDNEVAPVTRDVELGVDRERARLADLELEVREEVDKLDKKQTEAREWVTKRAEMMRAATDDIVTIYGKMAPDAAAAQLAEMDENVAAAVLTKLNPRAASSVLAEMQADKAAKLSTLIAGALGADKS
jgi:flagellar motility protein MotE (MotC chaperone)